jgi:endoglucanase
VKETIRTLVEAYGPSGNEERVREIIMGMVREMCDSVRVDTLGNLIAFRRASRPATGRPAPTKIMLAAHMDEIGIIVTHIDEKGFMRFSNVGYVDPFTALGQRVVFGNERAGVIWMEKLEKMKDLRLDKMFVDVGQGAAGDGSGVSVGDVAAFDRKMTEMGNRLTAKAMDDRIGCAILVETLRRLRESPNDLYFVFTVQEELGARGAVTSAFGICPDVGIAVDVTPTGDTPKAAISDVSLGKGAAIKVKDSYLVAHPAVRNLLVSAAESAGIPFQMEVLERGGTDAGPIHTTREGVPSGVISVPTRYIHTPCETVDLGDVEACVRLLEKVLSNEVSV